MISKATVCENPTFRISTAPDPEVGPDFLQRPSLRHLANEHNAGQNSQSTKVEIDVGLRPWVWRQVGS